MKAEKTPDISVHIGTWYYVLLLVPRVPESLFLGKPNPVHVLFYKILKSVVLTADVFQLFTKY